MKSPLHSLCLRFRQGRGSTEEQRTGVGIFIFGEEEKIMTGVIRGRRALAKKFLVLLGFFCGLLTNMTAQGLDTTDYFPLHAQLALRARQTGHETRTVSLALIHQSARGVQYASAHYVTLLQRHGIHISMSRTWNPCENSTVESFIKRLNTEGVYLNEYPTLAEAKQNISAFIESVYNIKRLHSSLGYCSPGEFEYFYDTNKAA